MNLLPPLLAGLTLLPAAAAHAAPVRVDHVEAELVAERTTWLPGAPNWVALRLEPDPGWHTYWRNPGDSGLPTRLEWSLPEGWSAGEIQWPYPGVHRLGDLVNYGYGEETLHLVALAVPPGVRGPATVAAEAHWLMCADICIPGKAQLSLTLPSAEVATAEPAWVQAFEDTRRRLPRAGALAGEFEVAPDEVRLSVHAGADLLSGVERAEFFAFANDLVNHAAGQRSATDEGRIRFAQARSAWFAVPPATVEGVLVLHASEPRAFTVSAAPGAVAALPPPPAPLPAPELPPAPALVTVLGFALLGGLILNLMPCVFPVLSIKAVSLIESRRGDPAAERRHALAYTAGVVLSCAAVALLLIGLRSGGESLGWGFQLQSPMFVSVLAYLLFALGLSLSGVVQFGTRLMGMGQSLAEQGGLTGSFFTGVLATVVASPCTAPFMGAALGYALVQPAPVALLVFVALGLGLALPFLLIGFVPQLAAWLPRPGAWMETFRQVMAFPLYLTVVWLVWVLGRQSGADGMALVLLGLTLVGFGLWLWGGARGPARTALAVAVTASALVLLAHPALDVKAVPDAAAAAAPERWSDARVAELRAAGRPVFVNFTADWCITCKVNERAALRSAEVKAAMERAGVAWLTADWTRADPEITEALARFGRSGVPLYLLYPLEGEPVVLPQILTTGTVIEAVEALD